MSTWKRFDSIYLNISYSVPVFIGLDFNLKYTGMQMKWWKDKINL